MRIAIHRRAGRPVHSGSWSVPWEEFCRSEGLEHEVMDVLAPNTRRRLEGFDILLYHFSNYDRSDMEHARSILRAARASGVRVFPDVADAWHFDDKIAQSYLLDALAAPIPAWAVFHSRAEFEAWLKQGVDYPFVAKLKAGSGSHHVSLVRNASAARRYGRRMFGRGIRPSPSLAFKATSNLRSSRSMPQVIARARRIPEFLRTRAAARRFSMEQDYVYLQEFIPNDGFDLKVAVVAGKTSFFARRVRPNDFRASGGADFFCDRSVVPETVVEAAQEISRMLGSLCMGYDFVVHRETGEPRIIEMSYGFSHRALLGTGGHWNAAGAWVDEPLHAPQEIVREMVRRAKVEADAGAE